MSARRYFAATGDGPGAPAREAVVQGSRVTFPEWGAREESAGGEGDGGGVEDAGDEPGAPGGATIRELASPGRIRRVLIGLGGRSAVAFAERRDGRWHIELEGREFAVRVDDERTHHIRELTEEIGPAGGEIELRAPMPGLVVRVGVSPGDEVRAGDGLVVMEAMKMENELRAERDGVVAEVHVEQGSTVDRDDRLVTFELGLEST